MKVKDLIKALSKFDGEKYVFVEDADDCFWCIDSIVENEDEVIINNTEVY